MRWRANPLTFWGVELCLLLGRMLACFHSVKSLLGWGWWGFCLQLLVCKFWMISHFDSWSIFVLWIIILCINCTNLDVFLLIPNSNFFSHPWLHSVLKSIFKITGVLRVRLYVASKRTGLQRAKTWNWVSNWTSLVANPPRSEGLQLLNDFLILTGEYIYSVMWHHHDISCVLTAELPFSWPSVDTKTQEFSKTMAS